MNLFGNKLRLLRIEAGLTQTDLAERVGVSVSYINKIEKGALKPPSEALISELALVLKTDKGKLLELANKIPGDIAQALKARAIKYFRSNLKELRIKADMSQYQFARKIGVDPSYINKIEKGTMPPPSKKLLLRMAEILKINKDELMFSAGRSKANRNISIKNSVRNFKDKLTSKTTRGVEEFGNIVTRVSTMNARSLLRVTVALLLVVAVGSSLWFASPHPVKALDITITDTVGNATLPAGTTGSEYAFKVVVDVQNMDILPVYRVDVLIYNASDSSKAATLQNLPLQTVSKQAHTIAEGSSSGSASVAASAGAAWGYGTYGSRTGYGYGYSSQTWGYITGMAYNTGYGYSYLGGYHGTTSITYTIYWTPPSGWAGTYNIKPIVYGDDADLSKAFTVSSIPSFTISAAAPTPTPPPVSGDDGVPSVPSSKNVSDIVNEDGEFTRSATLSSADGRATLVIPSGTVGLTAEGEPLSTVSITNVSPPEAPPTGARFMGIHFDCEPSGATFDPPALLTFEYNPNWLPSGATPDNLTIAYYDEDAGRWVELGAEDIEIDPTTNTITARVRHFTVFSILVRTNPAAFEVSGLKISPTSADVAEKVTISATVANTGDLAGSYEVVLKINGQPVSFKKVSVAGGASEEVTFITVQGQAGSYSGSIDGLSGTYTIKAVPTAPIVIAPSVPSVQAPEVVYPAPTAPSPPAVPAPVPAPTPWLAIILSLVVASIVAGILVWYYGFRRE